MKERIAIIEGTRTPFCKSDSILKEWSAADLGAFSVKDLLSITDFPAEEIDEVIAGNVAQPAESMNIARIIALKAGLPQKIPAFTVQRNCASGMEAITSAASKIIAGEGNVYLSCSTESMSHMPFYFPHEAAIFLKSLAKCRNWWQKLSVLRHFKLSYLKPVYGLQLGLTDPICGLIMGKTAEILAKEFLISREEQDLFALQSHKKANRAREEKRFAEEISPVPINNYQDFQFDDNGIRPELSIGQLQKLRPIFNRYTGSVTSGNSCQITDGACSMLLMRESESIRRGYKPLGYIRSFAYSGLCGTKMGLGPVYATAKLLQNSQWQLSDFDLIEINEAFSSQVLSCLKAFSSKSFCEKELNLPNPLGDIPSKILNVNGGAIALGHPVGASGMRLILTLMKELKRRSLNLGLATLCVGGGQGAAVAVEVNS
jgi:acetyl-CoA acetyltransferase family protein